ncbi:hypothetical protein VTO42DRAFT_1942 [Malbranchea cinnamomea]
MARSIATINSSTAATTTTTTKTTASSHHHHHCQSLSRSVGRSRALHSSSDMIIILTTRIVGDDGGLLAHSRAR